jgi:hypothetical protein
MVKPFQDIFKNFNRWSLSSCISNETLHNAALKCNLSFLSIRMSEGRILHIFIQE